MQRLILVQFLSGLLLAASFPQHTSSSRNHRRDLQILAPPTDQSSPLYPSLSSDSEPYPPIAGNLFEPPSGFLLSSSFPTDTTTSSTSNSPFQQTEPSVDTTYCTDKRVLVCCPQQTSGKYKFPDDGFLPSDCRLAAQYGVEFGKYPCRCCGVFYGAAEGLVKSPPLGSNCVDVTVDAEGNGGSITGGTDAGRGEYEGSWD